MLRKTLIHFAAGLLLIAALPALGDPPARVGRVSFLSGQVSFRTNPNDEWMAASLNYPVTSQNGFATQAGSRAEIRIGLAAIRVDEDSEISLPRVDDDTINVEMIRGVASVTVRSPESRYPIEVMTPAGKVTLNGPGTYRFEAGRDTDQTVITALRGSATLNDDDNQVAIREGRELVVSGTDATQYSLRATRRGPFDDWVFARDDRIDRSRSTRYVSPEITGQEDLDAYGDWQDTPDYGAVWMPRAVADDWAPYSYGRWSWVDPWGWTWVDYAPWGFAPFHYGRWVHHHGHWGWAPGVIAPRPVYAPALVGFVGRPGWSASFSFGVAPAVGWVPLGYYDIYRPAYPCSPTYVRNVNITNINVRQVNVTHVNWSNPPMPDYALRKFPHAVTVVPQSTFGNGRPVSTQVARFNGPVSEPVIGTAPPVAAPIRRMVVNDGAGQPRSSFSPGRMTTPQVARQPVPDMQRRGFAEPGNHLPDNRFPGNRASGGNDVPRPPQRMGVIDGRSLGQPDSRVPRLAAPGALQPTPGELAGRRFPHQELNTAPRPAPSPAPSFQRAPPVQTAPHADPRSMAPSRQAFDGSTKMMPHMAPQAAPQNRSFAQETRRFQEAPRAMQAPRPAVNPRAMQAPPAGDSGRNMGGGRRVAF